MQHHLGRPRGLRSNDSIGHDALEQPALRPNHHGTSRSAWKVFASALDLLRDPLPGATLLDLGAIQVELQEGLGIAVDVLTPDDIPAKFRDRFLYEAQPV